MNWYSLRHNIYLGEICQFRVMIQSSVKIHTTNLFSEFRLYFTSHVRQRYVRMYQVKYVETANSFSCNINDVVCIVKQVTTWRKNRRLFYGDEAERCKQGLANGSSIPQKHSCLYGFWPLRRLNCPKLLYTLMHKICVLGCPRKRTKCMYV